MMEHAQANLEVFAATLLELAGEDSDLSVVTSDSLGSARLTGSQMEIFRHYGIEGPWLATIAQQLLANH